MVELEPILKEYYEERGLNENGKPKEEKLKELGLDFAIPFLKQEEGHRRCLLD